MAKGVHGAHAFWETRLRAPIATGSLGLLQPPIGPTKQQKIMHNLALKAGEKTN
jgi:hypothetical protein